MEIDSDDPTVLTGQFSVNKSGTYSISFRTTGNQLNPSPVIYDIIAIPDRPPTARFVQPDQPSVKVPANVKVDLVMTGTDDYGVKDATLHVMMGNEKLVSKNMLEGQPPQPEFRAIETLDFAKLRREAGLEAPLLARRPRQQGAVLEPVRDRAPVHRGHRAGAAAGEEEIRRRPEDPAAAQVSRKPTKSSRRSSRRPNPPRLTTRTLAHPHKGPRPRSIKHRREPTKRPVALISARLRNRPQIPNVPTRMTLNNSSRHRKSRNCGKCSVTSRSRTPLTRRRTPPIRQRRMTREMIRATRLRLPPRVVPISRTAGPITPQPVPNSDH